jgi:hypothetical protein
MDEQQLTSIKERPIRELVMPGLEEPIQTGWGGEEWRRCHRFSRRLPAIMTTGRTQHEVTCFDIGYGGIRVVAPSTVKVQPGEHVTVRIIRGSESYLDEFAVVDSEMTGAGNSIHLSL